MAYGQDSDNESSSSIPPPPASPPKTPRKKIPGAIFNAVRTHMSVVRAAIGNNKSPGGRGGGGPNSTPPRKYASNDGGSPVVKEGDLYTWDADATPVASSNKSLAHVVLGDSSSSAQYNILQPTLYENAQHQTSHAVDGESATAAPLSPPILPSISQEPPTTAHRQRKFYMANEHPDPYPSPEIGDASGTSTKKISQISAPSIAAASPKSGASQPRSPRTASQPIPNLRASSWSWSEHFFFSQDDESVSTDTPNLTPPQNNNPGGGMSNYHRNASFPNIQPTNLVTFEPIMEVGDDDETCNNTIVEKVRQRSKKASRASTVGAFVTFLKALFGIGMLSNPAVLGEVGLLLGTFCHLCIVVGCAFACYLLLSARQLAKMEVMAKQRRDAEKRQEYEMWRAEMERRAAQRAGRHDTQSTPQLGLLNGDPTTNFSAKMMTHPSSTNGRQNALDHSEASSHRTLLAANTGTLSNEEEWTVTPVPLNIPLNRVATSMVPPKQGWVRCEDALSNSVGRTMGNPSSPTINKDGKLTTGSCGNVQMVKQSPRQHHSKSESGPGRSDSRDTLLVDSINSSETSRKISNKSPKKSQSMPVTDEYQRFSDKVHSNFMMPPPPPEPPAPPKDKPAQVRLVTYGDVAKYLAGKRASFFIIFTIVAVHLMFASGMVHLAVENLCYVIGWERLGWSYVEEYVEQGGDQANRRHVMRRLGSGLVQHMGYEVMRRLGPSEDEEDGENENSSGDEHDRNNASRSSDEEEYYLEWKGPDFIGRLAMAALLFPIIHGLLQIPSLTELATISTVGLITYAVGCIGSMLYTALVLTDGHPFLDHPDDMWKTKWSGIPTYVATTIYCIEGINLALPTVSSIEGVQRWGGVGLMRQSTSQLPGGNGGTGSNVKKDHERQDLSVFIVVGAVFLYGMVTLVVSWIGLAGGLGGGIGTIHGEDGCWDVTYCLNSSAVRFVYMLSLGIALVLTLPVILYPSTEMLEVWLDERNDERRRQREQLLASTSSPDGGGASPRQPFWLRQKSLLPDDETVHTATDTLSPSLGIRHGDIEMRDLSDSTVGDYVAPSCSASSPSSPEATSPMTFQQDAESTKAIKSPKTNNNNNGPENTKLKAKRKLKYWKLRMFLAFIICVIGTIEGSFPSVLKAAEVIRGVGLSIAGLIFPPLLYMSAVGGNFSVPMAAAMALLIGLGLFNIVLVLMSAFGARDFILEEGRGNFYDM